MIKHIKPMLMFLWQLPQNIVGLIIFLVTKLQRAKSREYNGTIVTGWKYRSCACLGQFIFVSSTCNTVTLKHEHGHYKQGAILGWLWPLVIGIPSFIWASCFSNYRIQNDISYYSFYTERWADKLNGIIR